jgi:predicted amidohydrolase YtcJ
MYHDHHIHPLGYASLLNGLELMSASTLDEVLTRVRDHAGQVGGAVIGQRLNDEGIADRRLPTRHDLDQAVSDRETLVYRYCGHIAVANSKALATAGIDADTPDPLGGIIDRDSSGNPTGVLRERAVALVAGALSPLVHAPSDHALLQALATLPVLGIGSITGIVSAGDPIWCGVTGELETLCRLAPDLPLDIDVLVIADGPSTLAEAAERIRKADGRIRFAGWKTFADGSFGGHTAAMHEPFTDRPDIRGTDLLRPEEMINMARASLLLGGDVAVHAIGDRANDSVLDLFEELIGIGAEPERLRIEHASLLSDGAIDRMARLGVVASVQPAFLASEGDWLHKRLGDERIERAYPFRSMMEAGISVIGGSDSPVELPDPAVGIDAAVERPGFSSGQKLTRGQAEKLFAPPERES